MGCRARWLICRGHLPRVWVWNNTVLKLAAFSLSNISISSACCLRMPSGEVVRLRPVQAIDGSYPGGTHFILGGCAASGSKTAIYSKMEIIRFIFFFSSLFLSFFEAKISKTPDYFVLFTWKLLHLHTLKILTRHDYIYALPVGC